MGKSTHFIGQPLYSHVIKLLYKSKILQISEDLGGERYTKCFNVWIHLMVILYANRRHPQAIFEAIYRDLYSRYRHELISDTNNSRYKLQYTL